MNTQLLGCSSEATSHAPISEGERRARQAAVDYGRATVHLEGFVLDAQTELLNAQYVAGELTSDELTEKILAL